MSSITRYPSKPIFLLLILVIIIAATFIDIIAYIDLPVMSTEKLPEISAVIEINRKFKRDKSWINEYNIEQLRQDLELSVTKFIKSKDLNEFTLIEIEIDVENSTIKYMNQFPSAKIGPLIALYWEARMVSFFSINYKFKMSAIPQYLVPDKKQNFIDKRYKIMYDKDHYFAFLPKYADIHAMDIIDIDKSIYNRYQDWILYLIHRLREIKWLYVYEMETMSILSSKIFLNIMRYETHRAYIKYYEYHNNTERMEFINNTMWINKKDDILIHIRCQDVLLNGQKTYGMSSLHYFYYGIKNVFNIKEFHENMAIHLVLYLDYISKRDGSDGGCHQYLYDYLLPSFISIFYPIRINLILNGSIDDDFYRFINAPNLICGTSSYCLMGGLCNNNNVIFPHHWAKFNVTASAVAQNIHYVKDPYFLPSLTIKQRGLSVPQIAERLMVIQGKKVRKRQGVDSIS